MEKNQKRKWLKIGLPIVGGTAIAVCAFFAIIIMFKTHRTSDSQVLVASGNKLKDSFAAVKPLMEDHTLNQALMDKYHLKGDELSPGWSIYGETLDGEKYIAYNEKTTMRSASVIKPFIVSAAYQYCLYPKKEDSPLSLSEAEKNNVRSLSQKAVIESDNEAANALILTIGEGDKNQGFNRINTWCRNEGFLQTSIGRLFLEGDPSGDNYTSATDCVNLLKAVYHKKLVNEQTSSELLGLLIKQSDRSKIPRYIDGQRVLVANKTGELNADYGLGFVDNDVALVYHEKGGFALAVLMGDENNHFDETNEAISQIAKTVFDAWISK